MGLYRSRPARFGQQAATIRRLHRSLFPSTFQNTPISEPVVPAPVSCGVYMGWQQIVARCQVSRVRRSVFGWGVGVRSRGLPSPEGRELVLREAKEWAGSPPMRRGPGEGSVRPSGKDYKATGKAAGLKSAPSRRGLGKPCATSISENREGRQIRCNARNLSQLRVT
jgi:hypothetical protein